MKDGEYTVFCLQQQWARQTSEWGNPDSPWEECEDKNWSTCGNDYWGAATDPHNNNASDLKWKSPRAHEDRSWVNRNSDLFGWTKLKYAIKAQKLAQKLDEKGEWDSIDPGFYSTLMQRIRHRFRIVKIHRSQSTEVVGLNEVVEQIG